MNPGVSKSANHIPLIISINYVQQKISHLYRCFKYRLYIIQSTLRIPHIIGKHWFFTSEFIAWKHYLYLVFKNLKIACKDSVKAFKIYVTVVNQFKKFKINRKQIKVILDRTLNIKSNGMKIHVWYSYMMWSSWQIVYTKEGRISPHRKEYLLLSMHTYTGRRTRPAKQRCWCHGFMRCPRKWIHFIHM